MAAFVNTVGLGGTFGMVDIETQKFTNISTPDNELFFNSGDFVDIGKLKVDFEPDNLDYALIPKQPVTAKPPVVGQPVIEQTNVFSSVSVVPQYVTNAVAGIHELRALLHNPDPSEEDNERALFASLEAYLDQYMTGDEINEVFPSRRDQILNFFSTDSNSDNRVFTRPQFKTPDNTLDSLAAAQDIRDSVLHANLFKVGQVILEDSRTAQRLRHNLVRLRRSREKELKRRKEELATLESEIVVGRRRLDVLNNERLEALGDAQAAQVLVEENWASVEAAYAERQRILEQNEDLYYTRVRETPVGRALPDPLALRYRSDNSVVPGCSGNEGENLPDELEPFLELLLELPFNDWTVLHGRHQQLPSRRRLDAMVDRRAGRITLRSHPVSTGPSNYASVRLRGLNIQVESAIAELSNSFIARPAVLSGYRAGSARVLSLEDLLAGPRGVLRSRAADLRENLELAILCLQQRLQAIPAGIRLIWAEAAEDDNLQVDRPDLWPGLSLADDNSFNDLRSLFELVEWWFAQLHGTAGTASDSAMRTTIRAVLMLSAGDDPHDLIHGAVVSAPGKLAPGAGFHLALNREPLSGALLQLIDPDSTVVGLLRVDDQDEGGTFATVTRVLQDVSPDTRYTVIGHRSGRI